LNKILILEEKIKNLINNNTLINNNDTNIQQNNKWLANYIHIQSYCEWFTYYIIQQYNEWLANYEY